MKKIILLALLLGGCASTDLSNQGQFTVDHHVYHSNGQTAYCEHARLTADPLAHKLDKPEWRFDGFCNCGKVLKDVCRKKLGLEVK